MGNLFRYNDEGVISRWQSKLPDITAKCVCRNCNIGWMSSIEMAAQPTLSCMIRGNQIALDRQAQNNIAAWLGLKAIVERYSQSPIHPVEPEWIAEYRQERLPPDSWYIRIARYVGNKPVRMASGPITMITRHNLVPFELQTQGLLFSLVIGYLHAQVLGLPRKTVVRADRRLFRQIWPHPLLRMDRSQAAYDDLITWPPEGWLGDSEFDRYAQNIMGQAQ